MASVRQPSLFTENPTISERFERWIEVNPEIWRLFKHYAAQLLHAGRKRYGAKAVVERLRWHFAIETKGGEVFKINNSFTSRLARKLIDEDSRFEEIFETRRLRSD